MILFYLLMGLLLLYFGWAVLYQLFFAIAGHLQVTERTSTGNLPLHFCLMIPAYREDAVIVQTARKAFDQKYPEDRRQVLVLADDLQPDTLQQLRQIPVEVVEIQLKTPNKAAAINQALQQIPPGHTHAFVILDADNEVEPDFLSRLNMAFHRGFRVVQGQRLPKNLDTHMAVLDAASEAANTHILCAGHRALGLSARLAGSGMAFEERLFREVMPQVDTIGGFDKELELRFTQRGEFIAFDPRVAVFDEKVRTAGIFSRQRSRWIAAQFIYGSRYLGAALSSGRLDFLNKAIQMWLPPRLLTPGFLLFAGLLCLVLGFPWLALAWGLLLLGNGFTFVLALPRYLFQRPYRSAFLHLPAAFWAAVLALFKTRSARFNFFHTPHG